jgi:hypothetical protein
MKSPRGKLEKKLDELWRSVGKAGARCRICETLPPEQRCNYTKLDPHHIVGRGNKVLRWDLRNRIWVCPTHHTMGKPSIIVQDNLGGWFLNWESDNDWMGKHRPEDKEYLREKHTIPYKQWTLDELQRMIEELKNYGK